MRKLFAAIACSALLLTLSTHALAADSAVDWNRAGSIQITLKNSSEPHEILHGATFQLFRVGTAFSSDGTLEFRLTDDFAASNISLDDLRAEGLAEHLATFAQQNSVAGVFASADASGCVTFDHLQLGLYLVIHSGSVSGYYNTLPFLLSLPMSSADGTGWIYNVQAAPKAERKPSSGSSGNSGSSVSRTSLTVQKKWNGPENARPQSVTVVLARNGKVYDTQELNENNQWTYKWSRLSTGYTWSVSETDVPDGYRVSYSTSGKTTTITNTYIPTISEQPDSLTVRKKWDTGGRSHPDSVKVELWNDGELYATATLSDKNNWSATWTRLPQSERWTVYEVDVPQQYEPSFSLEGTTITILNKDRSSVEEPIPLPTIPDDPSSSSKPSAPGNSSAAGKPTTPSKPTLIQTGQLNWPVPMLAGMGVVLFLIGWVLKRRGSAYDEK